MSAEVKNNENIENLKITTSKLDDVKLKLKRTAARENHVLKKVKKLESNVGEHCYLEKEGKTKHLEEIIQQKDNEINQL